MIPFFLEYEVKPGENLPEGLPLLRLAVLSPIWRGAALYLEYPGGDLETVVGWTEKGEPCEVLVFWTRENPRGPAVCLAIGGDAGLRVFFKEGDRQASRGLAFLALAESLIPPEVLEVVGPPPLPERTLLL
uniref:Uncharacterized protein n=1 Tax=Desulfobacca acetoxidans TaxID=60893 RepID=A0A7C5AL94_9BACT